MEYVKSFFPSRNESKSYDETNGYILNDVAVPEEILLLILSCTDIKSLLNCKLVCSKWNELIKSTHFWRMKLENTDKDKITKKQLPWYLYYCYFRHKIFDKNFLRNGNGENKFKHWTILANRGDRWIIEEVPQGADPLPENQLEFNGRASCFACSFQNCSKSQRISFKNNKLVKRILNDFQPTIYASEWFAGRFDCGCTYRLILRLYNSAGLVVCEKEQTGIVEQWEGSAWSKVEITCNNYGKDVTDIEFYHEGTDTQFWKGHYGSKMAGGVVKILFDSLL